MMDLFQKKPTIDEYAVAARENPAAIVLDVRTPEEYTEGHIPGSLLIPLYKLQEVALQVPDKDTVLYVYCRSGARSQQACGILNAMGYQNVTNIGGILSYKGEQEQG